MRVVFMGTPDFAVPALKALNEHHTVVGVVTRPDAPRKRGKKLYPSPVKEAALKLGIEPILEANSFKGTNLVRTLSKINPDIIVVAAYGAILPQEVLEMPTYGCINIHASLLPEWRGAAPIERAILAGDEKLGVSIMKMTEGLDEGDYCLQGDVSSKNTCCASLTQKLAELGAELLLEALSQIEDGTVTWIAQDNTCATYAKKIDKRELRLDPDDNAQTNYCRIQASNDSAPARVKIFNIPLRVMDAQVVRTTVDLEPGTAYISDNNRLYLGAADSTILEVLEVRPDGKRSMHVEEWLNGIQNPNLTWNAL